MCDKTNFELATAGYKEVPGDWMPATRVRPFIFKDPGLVWLEYHGKQHGFSPETSPYEFLDFIAKKSREFEQKWTKEKAPAAEYICKEAFEARLADKLRHAYDLITKRTPVIAQPALWWAPERIYGVPDLLIHVSWIKENFPELFAELQSANSDDYYLVIDIKFTTKLEEPKKANDLENNSAQVRLYTYMLAHIQGVMPKKAYLITRDRIENPLSVAITSELEQPLDEDLASYRDKYLDIKLNGAKYTPWEHEIVALNISNQEERWRTAKKTIALEKVPGRDSALLYQIGPNAKLQLAEEGYPSLDSMLQTDPGSISFEQCRGLGPAKSKRIRAILKANRTASPVLPSSSLIPSKRDFEFFADFEYFTNLNVDFEKQWLTLEGCEMIFMVGIGWEEDGSWFFETFMSDREDQAVERQMFDRLFDFLRTKTKGKFTDDSVTTFYHWTSAEVWQAKRVAERHNLPDDHVIRILPWKDLQKVFLDGPAGVPGAWGYGLKEVAHALASIDPAYDPHWPGDLDEGLRAMVMGWKAYESTSPIETDEMTTLQQYLEADCKALRNILRWLRS